MYSYNGDVVINGEKYEDGKEALARLQDYGCLHFKTDVILGVSEPRYDKAELEKQKAKDKELIEYGGRKKTAYEWQQGARRLEAETRRQRNISFMAKQSGDKILERNTNEKISFYRAKYDDLCDKVGIEKRYNRMGVGQLKGVDKIEKSGIIKEKELAQASSIFVNKNETLFRYAKNIKPEEGFEDIVSHANANLFEIDMVGNGNPDDFITLSPKQMVERIRNSNGYHGGDIRLIACQAGARENGAAQQVADILGKKVMAATEIVNVDAEGRLFVSDNRVLAQMWNEADEKEKGKFKETGKWVVFLPKNK